MRSTTANTAGSSRLTRTTAAAALIALTAFTALLGAGDRALSAPPVEENGPDKPIRKIFVPFDDLNVLLEGKTRRVFLSEQQYEDLLAKAGKRPERESPLGAAVLAAEYTIVIRDGRATMAGTLDVDVMQEGLHAIELELAGLGVRSAVLDGNPAAIGHAAGHRPKLFVEGIGRHRLVLDLTVPLATTAARQSLEFQVPTPPAARLAITVPGNVEVKSGASVIRREVDAAEGVTRLELLLSRGATSLVMSLNNRTLRTERAVVARSVMVDEVTTAYERLHATVSLQILHGAAQVFRFAVPEGFEVTDVSCPQLARWVVDATGPVPMLEARLREPTSETVVLNISAVKPAKGLGAWTMPRLVPQDVAGQVAVVGLLLEDRIEADSLAHDGLFAIDTDVLSVALPASVFQAEPGAPTIRPVAAYYAPQGDFQLNAHFSQPPRRLKVTANLLLVLDEKQHQMRGGFALLPEVEKLFTVAFSVPPKWHVTEVAGADEQPLPFEPYEAGDAGSRVVVRLPAGIPAGQTLSLYFHAIHTPDGWLGDWTTRSVTFPNFAVENATRDTGAIAVQTLDDLAVLPEVLDRLTPLDEDEKGKYGLADVPTALAYRYEGQPYAATLSVERTAARITAQTYSFLHVQAGALSAHYEIAYDVQEAATRQLSLSLPADTPGALSIRGLDGVAIKEFSGKEFSGKAEPRPGTPGNAKRRIWTVLLAERRRGPVRLAVDFQQRMEQDDVGEIDLPLIAAERVAYQSGMVAVEGHAELDIEAVEHPRKADVGELVDADYQVGRRLLGVFGFVGRPARVAVTITRHKGYALPPAIVERAELITLVSTAKRSQTAARFQLLTKAPFLEVRLPEQSKLWTVFLDGEPVKPQSEDGRLLVSLPAVGTDAARDLQIVYETPIARVLLMGEVEILAPKLFLRAGAAAEDAVREVPVADLKWHLHLPAGYRVARAEGSVFSEEPATREMPLSMAGKALFVAFGGVGRQYAREHATHDWLPSPGAGGVAEYDYDYAVPSSEAVPPPADAPNRGQLSGILTLETPDTPPTRGDEQFFDDKDDGVIGRQQNVMVPPVPQADRGRGRSYSWALEGIRGLKIELAQEEQLADYQRAVTFQSLGGDPRLVATLVHEGRLESLAWGAALLCALVGLALTRRSVRIKIRYVAVLLVLATLLPMVTAWGESLVDTMDRVFIVACLLVPYYLLANVIGWIFRPWCRCGGKDDAPATVDNGGDGGNGGKSGKSGKSVAAVTSAVLVLAALFAGGSLPVCAQEGGRYVVQVVEPAEPVEIPADAIVVPYDAGDADGIQNAKKLLVPYDAYEKLWNRAYPDKKIGRTPPPVEFALAGADYKATLAGDDFLLVTGHLNIDVYVDKTVGVPLALAGGVLAEARVDGRPARLEILQRGTQPNAQPNAPAQQEARQKAGGPPVSLAMLYVKGKGRKRLDLSIRLRLQRAGGWRIATGRIPAATATGLVLEVPLAETEVRLRDVADRLNFETTADGEQIATALGPMGLLHVRWRPRVSQGQVDQSLTADSIGRLDVAEDGLRLSWQLALKFGQSERDSFAVAIPAEYEVERVDGGNVRGWTRHVDPNASPRIEVTLLKPVSGSEQFTIHLARRTAIGAGPNQLGQFTVPVVTVEEAVLHRGRLAIWRSPLLQLRTGRTAGVTRTDVAAAGRNDAPAADVQAADAAESPLGTRPYQAFQFTAVPFTVDLSAEKIVPRLGAQVRSIVRIAERETRLESRIGLDVQDAPIHVVRLLVPGDLADLQVVAPEPFEWSAVNRDGRKLVSVYLAVGRQGEVPIVISGTLGEPDVDDAGTQTVPLPNLQVLDATRQEGDVAVQADPAVDVRAEQLQQCRSVLPDRAHGWLQPGQRELSRLVLHYESPDYAGVLRASLRKAQVVCDTVTNVAVTDRAIEETILLEFTIRQAGIRGLAFVLPAWMKDARIGAPMLRQKTVVPVGDEPGAPVRVRLDLQDEVMGTLRVLVQNDRLLTVGPHEAPIPRVETGRTERRFVVLENAGSDQIGRETAGLEVLGRRQKQWRRFVELLGGDVTEANIVQAYLVVSREKPRLSFQTKRREAVETAGARIGLARTLLVMDGNGTYRARQEYRVDNSTEQYLEIQLPGTARLWTATVAGQPVKPAEVPAAAKPNSARIPLVKTAAGDQDYAVVLKYGGRLPAPTNLGRVSFPLIHTVNINVERSQVRLRLPETHQWFNFRGTMRRVADRGDLEAGYVAYQNKKIEGFLQILSGKSTFEKARSMSSLKSQRREMESHRAANTLFGYNRTLQENYSANAALLEQAEKQIAHEMRQTGEGAGIDNRDRLNAQWERQKNGRARNVVTDLGGNWSGTVIARHGSSGEARKKFNRKWLESNQLRNKIAEEESAVAERSAGRKRAPARPGKPQSTTRMLVQPRIVAQGQPAAPEVAQGKGKRAIQLPGGGGGRQGGRDAITADPRAQTTLGRAQRYQRKLEAGLPRLEPDAASAAFGTRADTRNVPAATTGESQGLASLDVELPERGVEFLFTTPRGDVVITAQSVAMPLVDRLIRLAWVVGTVVVLLLAYRLIRPAAARIGARAGGVLLLLVGALGLVSCTFPLLSLLAIVSGILLVVRTRGAAAIQGSS